MGGEQAAAPGTTIFFTLNKIADTQEEESNE